MDPAHLQADARTEKLVARQANWLAHKQQNSKPYNAAHQDVAVRIRARHVQRRRQHPHAAALADDGPADARPV